MKIGFDAKRAFLNGTGLGNYSSDYSLNALKKYFPCKTSMSYLPLR